MKFWNNFKEKCALEYLDNLGIKENSSKEKLKYKILVAGTRLDDLIEESHNEMPFEEEHMFSNKQKAIQFGKNESGKGHNVELWNLMKRWH